MQIDDLRLVQIEGEARAIARITWEDSERPMCEIYFATPQPFGSDLSCNPHSFLAACSIPAMYYGEERISIHEEVCPEFLAGLTTALSWIRHWHYDGDRKPLKIEVKKRRYSMPPRKEERAGSFFSGGIDALATLRTNRMTYPLHDRMSIRDGLLVHGLEVNNPEVFKDIVTSLSLIAQDAELTLIPVSTNVGCLDEGYATWMREWEGAVFAAVAHAFVKRLSVVSLASSFSMKELPLHGSHPLLVPNYSSSDLQLKHDGMRFSRLDKIRLIADWDVAINRLRVCNKSWIYREKTFNCGRCEKCVRTMLALLVVGVLDKTSAFPDADVTKELISSVEPFNHNSAPYYDELLPALEQKGRLDLVRAIQQNLRRYSWVKLAHNCREVVKSLDRQYLGGDLLKLKRRLLPRKQTTAA